MPFLLDTGILLRVTNRDDPLHRQARNAVGAIKDRAEQAVTTLQNISEFWNVCTRPLSARGGLGLTVEQAERRLGLLEQFLAVLPEPSGLYERWRELVVFHRILGVKVHDAKLVAAMSLHGIQYILTFNDADFSRFAGITVVSPKEFVRR